MKRWLLLLWFPTASYAQCDLAITDVDLVSGTVTVTFNNTTNCGGTGGPDGVSEIQFGFQALDGDCNAMNVGWDFPTGLSIPDDNNHPGWIYSSTTTEDAFNWTNLYDDSVDPPYYAGEVVDFPIYNVYQSTDGGIWYQMEDLLAYWIDEGYSIQVVIWQISYGPTMYAADGGWAEVGVNGDGTSWGSGLYEDGNFLDNWYIIGPCGECVPEVVTDTVYVELPPDTTYVTEYDTTYVQLPPDTVETLVTDTVVQYDTTYVQLPPDTVVVIDTLPVPIYWYFYDTTYIELPPDTVVLWDTVTSYLTDTVYVTLLDTIIVEVDCETGEECLEVIECPIYAPNAFTPNNDGVNDTWFVDAPEDCWDNVNVKVYSRWGDLVWKSISFGERWDGGYDVAYVRDDVYTYHFIARNTYTNQWVERTGHVVVLR